MLDHLRAATFLIADGVLPSNKDQGYYVRRLIRRAIRFGHTLGVRGAFCASVASAYIETYSGAYPSLIERRDQIGNELSREEARFKTTLEKGLKEFEKDVFRNGFGFGFGCFQPVSILWLSARIAQELAEEKGQQVERVVFEQEFRKHQELSRAGSAQKFAGGLADHSEKTVRLHTATHLLHQALRQVLGPHVAQKGSNITPERLRFDFSHPAKMTAEEIQKVADIVNERIQEDLPVHFEILDIDEAKRRGAIGLFEDKYAALGNKIKVYFIGDQPTEAYFSKEVCGGRTSPVREKWASSRSRRKRRLPRESAGSRPLLDRLFAQNRLMSG